MHNGKLAEKYQVSPSTSQACATKLQ